MLVRRGAGAGLVALAAVCVGFGLGSAASAAELDDYVGRPDPAFAWEVVGQQDLPGTKITRIEMTSQVWQGIPWKHRLSVFEPEKVEHPDGALLFIAGGSNGNQPGADNLLLGTVLARLCGARVALLEHVPNQPLYDGKKEDALIAMTFLRYLETGDPSWPLLFPMTKSAVRAMDAVQAWARREGRPEPTKFVVTGASKRGWTTWLTSAVDDRVVGLAPMVIDTLNMKEQGPNQLKVWGKPSEQIADYTENDLTRDLDDQKLVAMWAMVDPYSYRDRPRLAKPKLLIHGTNDRYWTLNASTLYWNDLRGPKAITFLPNAGHNLKENRDWATNGVAALFRLAVTGRTLPEVTWTLAEDAAGATVTVKADPAPESFQPWTAAAPGRDFRDAKWTRAIAAPAPGAGAYRARVERNGEGNVALLVELTYEVDGIPYHLTTQIAETTAAARTKAAD